MAKETSNEQALLKLILEELQHSNQQLAGQHGYLEELKEKMNHPVINDFREKKVEELKSALYQYHVKLLQLIPAKVKHYYYVHTTTAIAFMFFIGLTALSWLYMDQSVEIRSLKTNAIKYRHLKLSENRSLIQLLNITDSLYIYDPGDFEKNVKSKERNRKMQPDLLFHDSMKERKAKNFRLKTEKKP
ncbi:hypothetical protein [Terrimonas pollutisoli]|uniref:hypothetical protein n=1 Tax=Terrimonas pollutisoli TaxID=3034147 RepID=UPI0023EB2280|nr:hypothetical protein [Terrimonas sp. H1YJ31]